MILLIKPHTALIKRNEVTVLLTLILSLFSPFVNANLTPKSHIGPTGIDYQAQMGVDYGSNSNVTYQHDDNSAISSHYYHLNPMFQMTGQRYTDTYQFRYLGDYLQYHDASSDDKGKHSFNFFGEWWYGLRHSLQLNVNDTIDREERGRGLTEGFTAEQFSGYGVNEGLKTNYLQAEARYAYGSKLGRGSLQIALMQKKIDYNELEALEEANTDFYEYVVDQEWVENSLIVELFDKKSKESRFRYTFITNQRRYDDSIRDSNEYYLIYGVQSQVTGKTFIDANVGWLYKDFINKDSGSSFNGVNWKAEIEWKPVEHSIFNVNSFQQIKDPTELGGYILNTQYGASWKHYWWRDRFYTQLHYTYDQDKYKKQEKNRHDKRNIFAISSGYDFRQSIHFELKYQIDNLDSNLEKDTFFIGPNDSISVDRTLGFEQSMVMFTVKVQI